MPIVSKSYCRSAQTAVRSIRQSLLTLILTLSCVSAFASDNPLDQIDFYNLEAVEELASPAADALQDEIEQAESIWQDYFLEPNDSIWSVFQNASLSERDLIELFNVQGAGDYLGNLGQVERLRYQTNRQQRLQGLHLKLLSGDQVFFHKRDNSGFKMELITEFSSEPLTRVAGSINGSFYLSGKAAGLSASAIMEFANIFQWNIDFNTDLRKGDSFELLISQPVQVSGGMDGDILGARFIQKDKTTTAIKHSDGRYYTPEGQLLGSTFSRSPLNSKFRVSSSFSKARKHPITGVVKAHKGTDWATPVGTPVYAPADGFIVEARKGHPSAGNYIEMRSGRRYVTRYLHMDSLKVKDGQQIRKGDLLGTTGNTGLSTGPHLHYELYINGRAVDAMTAKLPENTQLQGQTLERFLVSSRNIIQQLDQTLVAQATEL